MDPDATLSALRKMSREERSRRSEWPVTIANERCERYAELVDSLDGWLSQGGALPVQWKPGR